jgi:hypothetical protein
VTTIEVFRYIPGAGEPYTYAVEVDCTVYPGEMERSDSPGCPPCCEFLSATVDGNPFELTAEEMAEAEETFMSDLLDNCEDDETFL